MTVIFSNPAVSIATADDIPAVKDLLNSAYRGEGSKQGWTTEADLIEGDVRTDEQNLQKVIQQPGSVLLKYINEHGQLIGCVNLQQHGNRIYLGMFSVSPKLQGGGIGKQLLKASEEHAHHLQCSSIYMRVVSVRSELIDWYKRHGYADTGRRDPFEDDGTSGRHMQKLEFMVMEKQLTGNKN
ncbi:MAG TPA: GNAT family N-acetyltransferase [Ferruginibacter sp.]|nr:GNAT family N-acetyltransferase [Ferruginibacter sp.]